MALQDNMLIAAWEEELFESGSWSFQTSAGSCETVALRF